MKRADDKISTIIGKGAVIDGDFTATGSVRLDGIVEGSVKITGKLVVGATGKIHGSIEAAAAVIGGEVTGNVIAVEKAELTSTARVIGDIRTDLIVIDEKAIFQGKCDMNQEEVKVRKRPARESRAGKKSAKDALKEALKEVEEETRASEGKPEEAVAASAVTGEETEV